MGTARAWRTPATAVVVAVAAATAMPSGGPVSAHETTPAGALRLTVGWAEEPAVAGVANAVEVVVVDPAGAPVAEVRELRAEVTFGDERVVLALAPTAQAGRVAAPLVPTRPGTYTFHVVGSVAGQVVDVTSTCSEQTFDCVTDGTALQFPARDPSNGELATRLAREARAVARAEQAATDARRLAAGAVALGALAVGVSVVLGRRRARGRA